MTTISPHFYNQRIANYTNKISSLSEYESDRSVFSQASSSGSHLMLDEEFMVRRDFINMSDTFQISSKIGQAVNLTIEQFVTIGEVIADDFPDVKLTMHAACKDARDAGVLIEQYCIENEQEEAIDKLAFMRTTKRLLTSITRILLLADMVVVKQLISTKDRVNISLGRLEVVSNFTEFVKAFTQFGNEMIELATLTGERQNDLINERHRAQMLMARQILDRSTILLLMSSKLCLKYPECVTARENRDTVFNKMRQAIDLINFVVKYGLVLSDDHFLQYQKIDNAQYDSISSRIKSLKQFLELCKLTLEPSYLDNLQISVESVIEFSQDFTDSAYTSHDYRENILLLTDRLKLEMHHLLELLSELLPFDVCNYNRNDVQKTINIVKDVINELVVELIETAMQQAVEIDKLVKLSLETINLLRLYALDANKDLLHNQIRHFYDLNDHIIEICKLLHHIATTESLKVYAKFTEHNFRIFGPQVISATKTVSIYPESKIVLENLETFIEVYQLLLSDIKKISCEIDEKVSSKLKRQSPFGSILKQTKQASSKPLKSVRLDLDQNQKAKILECECKPKSKRKSKNENDDEHQVRKSNKNRQNVCDSKESDDDDNDNKDKSEVINSEDNSAVDEADNEILRRAKNLSDMAIAMFEFTRGNGPLKTTQDLFTQAEFYAEEANRLYKVIRLFSYQVPSGDMKKDFLELIDQLPSLVQRLQFIVKEHTVGKVATFTKVDNVILEIKQLMATISKVVNSCLECSKKYNIELNDGIFVNRNANSFSGDGLSNMGGMSGSNSGSTSGSRTGSDGQL